MYFKTWKVGFVRFLLLDGHHCFSQGVGD